MNTDLRTLRRLQWGLRATLALGVAASVAANVLHARPDPISQAVSAWPPIALLLAVEWMSRVPVHQRSLSAIRIAATAVIAGIAAWVSYWHMAAVAAKFGETGSAPYLLPFSVDGLIVVASVSLVELAAGIRATESHASGERQGGLDDARPADPLPDGPALPSAAPVVPVRTDRLTRLNNTPVRSGVTR